MQRAELLKPTKTKSTNHFSGQRWQLQFFTATNCGPGPTCNTHLPRLKSNFKAAISPDAYPKATPIEERTQTPPEVLKPSQLNSIRFEKPQAKCITLSVGASASGSARARDILSPLLNFDPDPTGTLPPELSCQSYSNWNAYTQHTNCLGLEFLLTNWLLRINNWNSAEISGWDLTLTLLPNFSWGP